jgi:hypothetical protein
MQWCSYCDDEYDDGQFEFKEKATWKGEVLYGWYWHKPPGEEQHPCADFDFGPLAEAEEGWEEAGQ